MENAIYETPFADVTQEEQSESPDPGYNGYTQEVESPFMFSYQTEEESEPVNEEALDLLSSLHDETFDDALYGLANEVEETWRTRVSNPLVMGETFVPFATQQARDYFNPLIRKTEDMIDSVASKFEGSDLADYSEVDLETLLAEFGNSGSGFTPAQEQFFGKVFKKVKSVVKKGVDLAKKGIRAVGKILPMNILLGKLKKLIRPLLDKVLKFAIGKLPANFRPYAKKLASRFLNRETSEDFEEEEFLFY